MPWLAERRADLASWCPSDWRAGFEWTGRGFWWRCRVCDRRGYMVIDPDGLPSSRSWMVACLDGHGECLDCGKMVTAVGLAQHRLLAHGVR